MNAVLQKKLKVANALFKKAQEAVASGGSGDFYKPDNGRYEVGITDGEVNESQQGRLQMFLEFTIAEGQDAGQSWRKYWGLDKPESIEWAIKDMARFGYEIEAMEQFAEAAAAIVAAKTRAQVRVKENGDFTNTYIQKVYGASAAESATEPTPEEAVAAEETAAEVAAEFVPEVGQRVVNADGKAGVVKSLDAGDKDAIVKYDDGSKESIGWAFIQAEESGQPAAEAAPAAAAAEPEPEPEQSGGDAIAPGMRLAAEGHGIGIVKSVNEEAAQVTLTLEGSKKVVTVGVDVLSLPPEPVAPKKPMLVKKK